MPIGLVAQSAQELYQRGLVQEHANGDLKQAIALYAQAAQTAGSDRALAAKALIRMAGSQEKLGEDAEAASAYAELVRAYPEQRAEVAIAQDRLRALRQATRAGAAPTRAASLERRVVVDAAAVRQLLRELSQRGEQGRRTGPRLTESQECR